MSAARETLDDEVAKVRERVLVNVCSRCNGYMRCTTKRYDPRRRHPLGMEPLRLAHLLGSHLTR